MAAKGTIAKENITNQILSTFNGSFIYGKEIRIPYVENGTLVQIKIALTCAKENVDAGADTMLPGEAVVKTPVSGGVFEITAQEQSEVNDLISKLGL
jgi:hypothetical protein